MRTTNRIRYLLLLSLFSVSVPAGNLVGLSAGQGSAQTDGVRLYIATPFPPNWLWEQLPLPALSLEWNAGIWWQDHDQLLSAGITPIASWEHPLTAQWQGYLELGLGLDYISQHQLGSLELGSQLLFGGLLGVGIRSADWSWGLRSYHYSNAALDGENNSMNMLMLEAARRW